MRPQSPQAWALRSLPRRSLWKTPAFTSEATCIIHQDAPFAAQCLRCCTHCVWALRHQTNLVVHLGVLECRTIYLRSIQLVQDFERVCLSLITKCTQCSLRLF